MEVHPPHAAAPPSQRWQRVHAALRWLLSLDPKEELPTDPLDTLYRSFHLTAKCRYNASIRLRRLGRFSFITGIVLALGLIFIPLLQLSDLKLAYPTRVLNTLQIFLAVAALVYSVINATAHYETRSRALNDSGDSIKALSRELRTAKNPPDAKPVDLQSFNQRYEAITTKSENHTRSDYWLALLQASQVHRITGFPRLWLYVKTYVSQLTPYSIPALLMAFELLLILDILFVTRVFTSLFNTLAGRPG